MPQSKPWARRAPSPGRLPRRPPAGGVKPRATGMCNVMNRAVAVVLGITTALFVSTFVSTFITPPASAAPATACGTPLSRAQINSIVRLTDTSSQRETTALGKLDAAIADLRSVTDILTRHHDRRGLFAVGLYSVERDAVTPLQHRVNAFEYPRWGPRISLALLNRFFDAVHAEFTGAPVPRQWQTYFALTRQCAMSPARTAMVGYNAHLTVDLAYAVADVKTTAAQARDYFTIVDTIARHAQSLVDATTSVYGPAADLGPLFRFYFVGEGLDRLVGAGKATGLMLRAADVGYNSLTFTNGLALQNPSSALSAQQSIWALWQTADVAFTALTELELL